jgi:ribosomal protein S18 acetylase RimI-like enzyme
LIDRLIIRPFAPADQTGARSLILTGLGEHFGYIDETRNPDIDDIQAYYVRAGHTFLVAEQAGTLLGTGALVREASVVARIVRVSVDRACRRCGIARNLVCKLIAIAARQGVQRLLVETNHDWTDALGFYLALGFTEYDRDAASAYLALDLQPEAPNSD